MVSAHHCSAILATGNREMGRAKMKFLMIACLVLSLVAAAVYILMGTDVISVPGLKSGDAPPGIVFAAGGCYILGGVLILARRRWLWITGLVMNTLVLVIFFMMYNQKPEIMFSVPGLGTKIAQILLEAGLVYLIATFKREPGLVYSKVR
jgi:hypothetical protein